jgi:hypothetical protein
MGGGGVMGYARIRPDLIADGTLPNGWEDAELRDLEGAPINYVSLSGKEHKWVPESEWVKSICFDGMSTGLYVLTEDDDSYFTCHSIDLEFAEEIPNG